MKSHDKGGFTIVEIIVVVVLLGIMASMAIPKIIAPTYRVISSEGKQTLITLLGSQKRYFLETGAYTNTLANLDVNPYPVSTYFNDPTVATTDPIASVQARAAYGGFTLSITSAGVISCASGTVTCAQIKM